MGAPTGQRSFDDLGTPLHEVTFVVVDLETTGGSPQSCAITEIGAVKVRGGESLGTFQTLVNPGEPIPPAITHLTGITDAMVSPAPPIGGVLAAFLEFLGDAVVVGHNIRFDLSFLNAAMARSGRPRLPNRSVDTCALARRLVREEVPDCRLGTLASRLRLGHTPTHRALDDALATAELLHVMLERAGTLGVLGLDDLLALPTVSGHPQLAKLKLVAGLPRAPGVYLFRDAGGRPLYVGRAVDLRRRVRSYFTGDDRRKIGPLLREMRSVDHVVCANELEAAVLELRLIHRLAPRYNSQGKRWRQSAYVKLTLDERFPRLSVVRRARPGDGCLYLGPVASTRAAKLVVEAVESAVPLRRCTRRPTKAADAPPCTPAQLGVATCPCAGLIGESAYAAIVERVVEGVTADAGLLLAPLAERMRALAGAGRFEEAADVRDRAAALARVLNRQRRTDALRRAGRLVLELRDGGRVVVNRGVVTSPAGGESVVPAPPPATGPLPVEVADEVACVASWLDSRAGQVRVVECEAGLALPCPAVPSFTPAPARVKGA